MDWYSSSARYMVHRPQCRPHTQQASSHTTSYHILSTSATSLYNINMDVDKSLDDLISDKRQTRAPQKPRSQGQGQGGQGPRHSAGGGGGGGGRRESPYAVRSDYSGYVACGSIALFTEGRKLDGMADMSVVAPSS